MVPPEVTATTRASLRLVMVSVVRSQTTRGSQLGELVGGIPAGEHVQHALQLLARQVAERVRPA